jgi:hypothetical protein
VESLIDDARVALYNRKMFIIQASVVLTIVFYSHK